MSDTIGLAMSVYNEHNALPGALEMASRLFDDVWIIHAGPGGKYSDDGTIEILEQYGVRVTFDRVDDGFGVLRTKLLRAATTTWTVIMDADERLFPWIPEFACSGTGSYPAQENPDLHRGLAGGVFNQGDLLREKLNKECKEADALRLSRRHWFDLGMHRPCQDWTKTPDWQLRILRNKPNICYDPNIKMHERAVDLKTGRDPVYGTGDTRKGPFFDHMHLAFKKMEPEQRKQDIRIYDALATGQPVPIE